MTSKAQELDNTKDGDRNNCPICHPLDPTKWVPAWKVWEATLKYGGSSVRT